MRESYFSDESEAEYSRNLSKNIQVSWEAYFHSQRPIIYQTDRKRWLTLIPKFGFYLPCRGFQWLKSLVLVPFSWVPASFFDVN